MPEYSSLSDDLYVVYDCSEQPSKIFSKEETDATGRLSGVDVYTGETEEDARGRLPKGYTHYASAKAGGLNRAHAKFIKVRKHHYKMFNIKRAEAESIFSPVKPR